MSFKHIDDKQNGIIFADTANPDSKLSFTTERSTSKSAGKTVPYVRTNTLFTGIDVDTSCDDVCGPSASFARAVRVVTSGRTTSAALLVADLEFIVAELKKRPEYFEGFRPNALEVLNRPVAG